MTNKMLRLSVLVSCLLIGSRGSLAGPDRASTLQLDRTVRQKCLRILRAGLRSKEFWPAIHAAEALTLAGYANEVRQYLSPKLVQEKDDQRRCGLARELVRAGDSRQAQVMLKILAGKEPYGHVHAAESLYKVGEAGDGNALRQAARQRKKPVLQLMAAAALARQGDPRALAVIRTMLKAKDPLTSRIAAWIVARIGNVRDIPQLHKNLKEAKDPLTRCYIEHALAALGDGTGLRALQRNLSSSDAAIRTYAATFAGDARATTVAPQLIKRLDDDTLDARIRAAQSLLVLAIHPWQRRPLARTDKRFIERPGQPPTSGTIRSDVRYAIALGVRHLNSLYNPDDNNIPFFGSAISAQGKGYLTRGSIGFRVSHITGRCLLGCMLAEETAGIPFPQPGLKILEAFHKQQFNNRDHLNSYLDPSKNNRRFVQLHNLREGLFGLYHLAKGRKRKWAQEKADGMIETLLKITDSDGRISVKLAQRHGLARRLVGRGPSAVTTGRAIDPLVEYYRFSGNKRALRLARLFANGTLKRSFTKSGRFKPQPNPESTGHLHSLTSSLSGIALYAEVAQDHEMIEWVRRVVDVGVPQYSTSWGWMVEGMHGDQKKGEMNQTGDVIRTALSLARSGRVQYYELAERWCRNMLLQAQHRETEMKRYLSNSKNPAGDRERNVLTRNIGGYGIKHPNARMGPGDWAISTLDIASGATHALCEVWKNRATTTAGSVRINLLFDLHTKDLELKSSLPLTGRLRFFLKSNKKFSVRIPSWVDRRSLQLEIQGQTVAKPTIVAGYLQVGASAGSVGTIKFKLPQSVSREKVDGQTYTATWWGNQVIDIHPRGKRSPIPF